jgi:hypothetical protein
MRSAVMEALRGVGGRLARCGDASARTGFGGGAEIRGPIYVTLEMEMLDGEARIVEAEPHGSPNDAFVACAQRTLRGEVIPLREARPGGRMRLAFPLRSRAGPPEESDAAQQPELAPALEVAPVSEPPPGVDSGARPEPGSG